MDETPVAVVSAVGRGNLAFGPKAGQVGDLILRCLLRSNGIIKDDRRIANKVRKMIELIDTPANRGLVADALHLMAQNEIIELTETHVLLLIEVSDKAAATLVSADRDTRKQLNVVVDEPTDAKLVKSVKEVYTVIQEAADMARAKQLVNAEGHVAINVSGVLLAAGIKDEVGQPACYYLNEIRQIACHEVYDAGNGRLLWWWTVDTQPLNVAALRECAGGDRSYEASGCEHKPRTTEESGTPQTFALTAVPSVDLPTAVPVGLTGPAKESTSTTARPPRPNDMPQRRPVRLDELVTRLVNAAKQLQQDKNALEQVVAEHAAEVEGLKTEHAKEVEGLHRLISELHRQILRNSVASNEATEFLASLNGVV